MSGLVSKLLGSSGSQDGPPPTHQFVARPSPHYSGHLVVHPAGYPVETPPLYTVIVNTSSKPNVLVYRGDPAPVNCVGDATISSISSKIKCNARDQPFILKSSTLGDKFTIDSPTYGYLKWKTSDFSSAVTLLNGAGSKLAEYRSDRAMGGKVLNVYVPCDGQFIELLILTAITVRTSDKQDAETGLEVVGAVVGI